MWVFNKRYERLVDDNQYLLLYKRCIYLIKDRIRLIKSVEQRLIEIGKPTEETAEEFAQLKEKVSKHDVVQFYFQDEALLDSLIPTTMEEVKHKIMYFFSAILYPNICLSMIDGKGRITSSMSAMVRNEFVLQYPDHVLGDSFSPIVRMPPHGKYYSTIAGASVTQMLYSPGRHKCMDKFLQKMRDFGVKLQGGAELIRNTTMKDKVVGVINHNLRPLRTFEHTRRTPILQTLFPAWSNLQIAKKSTYTALYVGDSCKFQQSFLTDNNISKLKKAKKRVDNLPMDGNFVIVPQNPMQLKRPKKNTLWSELSNKKPPAIDQIPKLLATTPGITADDMGVWLMNLIPFVSTFLFDNNHPFIESCVIQTFGNENKAAGFWFYRCLLPSYMVLSLQNAGQWIKFDQEKPIRDHSHWMYLIRLIVGCVMTPYNYKSGQIASGTDNLNVLSAFFTQNGGPNPFPLPAQNKMINKNGLIMGPLILAKSEERRIEHFHVSAETRIFFLGS